MTRQRDSFVCPLPPALRTERALCAELGRIAVIALYDELTLYPKPGLVSPVDNGSHEDMTAETFFRSLFALRRYFVQMAEAGLRGEPFPVLKQLGITAEARMLRATGGVNTHRGAIFAVGLLCAAAALCHAGKTPMSATGIRHALASGWGTALIVHARHAGGSSHGAQVARLHAASGAREEAARGMPSVFGLALPALEASLARTGCWERARIEAFFTLMAGISDTNVYYRGGEAGARMVKSCAREFLARGGTTAPDWKEHATACHRRFIEKRLSPGGAADLLGAACFISRVLARFGQRDPAWHAAAGRAALAEVEAD